VNPTPIRAVSSPNAKPLPSTVVRDDEGSLVAAAKAGDLNAFQELVSRYEAKIYRLSWNITRNKEDAEDSMQDAFLKAFQHLDGFEGGSRFYTWLVRIAVNEALMKLRKRRPNQISLDEPVVTDGDDLMPRDLQDWGPSPEQRYARTELNQILTDAIEDLDAPYRMAFVLRDVSDLIPIFGVNRRELPRRNRRTNELFGRGAGRHGRRRSRTSSRWLQKMQADRGYNAQNNRDLLQRRTRAAAARSESAPA
jgi:RNA polymerase sigma-70 factor (ECF subfamily)